MTFANTRETNRKVHGFSQPWPVALYGNDCHIKPFALRATINLAGSTMLGAPVGTIETIDMKPEETSRGSSKTLCMEEPN